MAPWGRGLREGYPEGTVLAGPSTDHPDSWYHKGLMLSQQRTQEVLGENVLQSVVGI